MYKEAVFRNGLRIRLYLNRKHWQNDYSLNGMMPWL